MSYVMFPLEKDKPDVRFRFTIKQADALEERAGCAPAVLAVRGQAVRSMVMLVCYGLREDDPSMTETRAQKLIQRYLDNGGKTKLLMDAVVKALRDSGIYGEPDVADDEEGDEAASIEDPQPAPETE